MTYTGTDKIMYVVDSTGKKEHTSAHVSFDEAHMTSAVQQKPPMAIALEQAGYRTEPFQLPLIPAPDNITLKIKPLAKDAIVPSQATSGSAGYDIYSNEDAVIYAGDQVLIHTGISMEIPENQDMWQDKL